MTLPISHAIFIDLTTKNQHSFGKYGGTQAYAAMAKVSFCPTLAAGCKERTVAKQNIRTALPLRRGDVVEMHEPIEGRFERSLVEVAFEVDFTPHAFQVRDSFKPNRRRLMPAQILDGRALAAEMRTELKLRAVTLRARGVLPRLAILFVGENESSLAYVRNLIHSGERCGIEVVVERLPEGSDTAQVRAALERLKVDQSVHGVMLQQPLPPHLSIRRIADAIPAEKDVDGAHPTNQGHLAFGSGTRFIPATPAAVIRLLERSPHWPPTGRRAVVIGRSIVVGMPVALLLLARDATVTVLHKESANLQPDVRLAEIVVVATGVPGLIGGADLAPGATVIDVGTTVVAGVLRGDVDFESASKVAGAITPVPGGVGPVTNMTLLQNVIEAAESTLPIS